MDKPRIMLVEDEAITALCLRDDLTDCGYNLIATVTRGEDAVRLAKELRPDLILMDITLADKMNGIEAAERILRTQQIPIIFMTAHTDSETLAQAKRTAPFGYLTKPYQLDTLKNTIEISLYKSAMDAIVREREKHYRLLFQSMSNGFALHEIICDAAGRPCDYRFLEINPAYEALTGLKAEEIIGKTVLEVLPGTEQTWIESYGKVALSGEAIHIEDFSSELHRFYDVKAYSPQSGQFVTIINDITERKEAETIFRARLRINEYALNHSLEELLQKTLDEAKILTDSTIGFFHFLKEDQVTISLQIWSNQTEMIVCTAQGKEQHYSLQKAGVWADCIRTRTPLIHNDYETLPNRKGLPPGHAPIQRELVVPIFRNHLIIAIIGVGNKPSEYTSHDIERIEQLANLAWDIVEHKRIEMARRAAEEVLRESEARYRQLFLEFDTIINGIPDALTLWSPEMRLLLANKGAVEHYRNEFPDLLGRHCKEICRICNDHPEDCEVRRCFLSKRAEEKLWTTPEGQTLGIKAFPLIDDSGKVTQVIRLASDLTERMQLREEAARSAHLAALGELAAGVAHEINNPTGLILLEMPILRDAFRDARPILEAHFETFGDFSFAGMRYSEMREQLGPMINEISEGAQRIKKIVMELKDFSRPSAGNAFVVVDLNEVVSKASSLVAGRINKLTDDFKVEYADEAVLVSGNFQKLEQVVINLIVNACQSLTHRSGKVTVQISAVTPRGFANVTIRDQGVGIRPEHLKVITDPFFTTRRETGGTGLGLSISMRIVEEHHGTLRFDSAPQRGTVVTLELPLAEKLKA